MEDCEGRETNNPSFRVGGRLADQRRISGVVLRRCYSHDDRCGFLLTYAENLTLEDCTSTNASDSGICISGVNGAILTRSPDTEIVRSAFVTPGV